MEISSVQQTTSVLTPAESQSGATNISSDFEMFLQMLTAQMQYQDPLNPIDSTDYATQLATFSGVEQAVLTNDLLKSLTAQMNTGGLVDMAAVVGKEVRTTDAAFFDGQPLSLFPTQTVAAETAELVVRNEAGDEVQRLAVPTDADTLTWAGVGEGGAPLPSGSYQFEIVATTGGETIAQIPVATYGIVDEVSVQDGKTMLVLVGGATVAGDEVTALREARG